MHEPDSVNLKQLIENCCLHRLSKKNYETEDHVEFHIRKKNIDKNFLALREYLGEVDLKLTNSIDIHSSLLLLYKELQTEGDWNTENTPHYAAFLSSDFEKLYASPLDSVLKIEDGTFNAQQVFDLCLDKLHNKLTIEDIKKYPSLIQVYGLLLKDVKEYKVVVNPLKTLPISLLLIDDHITANKIVGLKSCIAVLTTLEKVQLSDGNYHEVIYASLSKARNEKDLEVTKLTIECLLEFLPLLSSEVQETKTDEAFSIILEDAITEQRHVRRVKLINGINKLINIHGVNCVKRKKKFNAFIIEHLDLSYLDLLEHVLECMQTWIQYCWCAWKYASDKKILQLLIKLLYAFGEDKNVKVQDLIVALVSLCEEHERNEIISRLKNSGIQNERFSSRLEVVLNNVLNKFK